MDISFKDIVDTDKLQRMMDKLYKATKIPIGILDIAGNILVATGWQDICTKFHRVNPITKKRCIESDNFFHARILEDRYVQYKCKNGLWDIAIPILVEGNHIASLYVGQFFYEDEKPDIEFFKKQAIEAGFDEEEYLKALKKIRVFSREGIIDIMDFYADFASFVSELAYANLKLKHNLIKLEGLLPICAKCKKIRDDKGYWHQIEVYISEHSKAFFSHGLCDKCSEELYGEEEWFKKKKRQLKI